MAKELAWVGRALDAIRDFQADVRRDAGHQLHLVELGLDPHDWRPMPSVGAGVIEIRLHAETEHRVFYIATFREAVYVLHAFQKKTRKTAQSDIELGRENLKEVRKWRRERGL